MVTCSVSMACEVQQSSMDIASGIYLSSRGGILGSSMPRGTNPGGGSSSCLGMRTSSSGETTPSSLEVGGGLGAGALVGSSTLGIGEGALFKDMGAMGSFLAVSNISISILKRLSSSTLALGIHGALTPQNTFGEALAWIAHIWNTIASATVSSLHTS